MCTGIIYKATSCTTGLSYIGQTIKSLEERAKAHWQSKKNKSKFHDALLELGKDDFVWEVLEEVEEIELSEREKYWIAFYDSYYNGYNSDAGGCYSPEIRHNRNYSIETRKVMSAKAKNRVPWNKGLEVGPLTEEQKNARNCKMKQRLENRTDEEKEKWRKQCSTNAKGNKSTIGYHWKKDPITGKHIYYKEQ